MFDPFLVVDAWAKGRSGAAPLRRPAYRLLLLFTSAKWNTTFACTYGSESLFGIRNAIVELSGFFLSSAPSTLWICDGFQTFSSYRPLLAPERSSVSWSRADDQVSERIRRLRLWLPNGGKGDAALTAKSFRTKMRRSFCPSPTGKLTMTCWSWSFASMRKGSGLPFNSTRFTVARRLTAGRNSTVHSTAPEVREASKKIPSVVFE